MTPNETQGANGFYKLSWLQRIGFGSGDLAQNLIFQTVACYLMIYLTTVLKINPAFVSGLILTVRLIDCFWSPVVGRYIDNRNPKLGKYRTYLLYGGRPIFRSHWPGSGRSGSRCSGLTGQTRKRITRPWQTGCRTPA